MLSPINLQLGVGTNSKIDFIAFFLVTAMLLNTLKLQEMSIKSYLLSYLMYTMLRNRLRAKNADAALLANF